LHDEPSPLAGTGIRTPNLVHANLAATQLVAHAIRRKEAQFSEDGALIVRTGFCSGRSVQNKFVVNEPESSGEIWWGQFNQKLAPEKLAALYERVQAHLQTQKLFTQDLYAGSDPAYRIRVCIVSTGACQSLVARYLFIRPPAQDLPGPTPDYVI
jgi:phosphoenolpyruvate carboxykinase (ATP)